MKTIFAVLSLCLFAGSSFANFECTHAVGTVKKGLELYEVNLKTTKKEYAMLKVKGEAAARKLKCTIPLTRPGTGPRCFDCPRTIAVCNDTGYEVVITGGGITGKKFAQINTVTRRGNVSAGKFRCEQILEGVVNGDATAETVEVTEIENE